RWSSTSASAAPSPASSGPASPRTARSSPRARSTPAPQWWWEQVAGRLMRRHFERCESLAVTGYETYRYVRIHVGDDAIGAWCMELVLLRYELSTALVVGGRARR